MQLSMKTIKRDIDEREHSHKTNRGIQTIGLTQRWIPPYSSNQTEGGENL